MKNQSTSSEFDNFRRLASEPGLNEYARIGFPDELRKGIEPLILRDISGKVTNLLETEKRVLDIGPGCGELARLIIAHCQKQGHSLVFTDSEEMLAHLPECAGLNKVSGMFPLNSQLIKEKFGSFDAIICYSVLQYIYLDAGLSDFIEAALDLLAPGGEMLLGDIPNISKRRRFFSSDAGKEFHRNYTKSDTEPPMDEPGPGKIDDTVVFSILEQVRKAGADGYVLPQATSLPFANRREDILIRKP